MQLLDYFTRCRGLIIYNITPLLRQLHWLKAKELIDFKLAILCSSVHTGLRLLTSPVNLVVQLIPKLETNFARHRHLYRSFVELALRPWVIGHFRSLRHVYGTIFHSMSSRHLPFESLKIV